MSDTAAEHSYTLKRVQELLGLSRSVVAGLIKAGFVTPDRGARGEHRFSFQDLMLLRTARALQAASVPTQRIMKSLTQLRADLPEELPMSGLRITAIGSTVAVRDRDGSREAASGQFILDFEVAIGSGMSGEVTILERRPPNGQTSQQTNGPTAGHPVESARRWLDRGESLEQSDPEAAEAAYRQALTNNPGYIDAYLNLGTLLCERLRAPEAVALYAEAFELCDPSALLHFNQAIALEDTGDLKHAVAAYERCLSLDPTIADAHFNAARLLERLGDMQATLRHFNAYRRMSR